jgi:hypothetical protein
MHSRLLMMVLGEVCITCYDDGVVLRITVTMH